MSLIPNCWLFLTDMNMEVNVYFEIKSHVFEDHNKLINI